jgi:hypothetical protein
MGGIYAPPILSIKPQQAFCKNPIRGLTQKYQEQSSAATQNICNKGSFETFAACCTEDRCAGKPPLAELCADDRNADNVSFRCICAYGCFGL